MKTVTTTFTTTLYIFWLLTVAFSSMPVQSMNANTISLINLHKDALFSIFSCLTTDGNDFLLAKKFSKEEAANKVFSFIQKHSKIVDKIIGYKISAQTQEDFLNKVSNASEKALKKMCDSLQLMMYLEQSEQLSQLLHSSAKITENDLQFCMDVMENDKKRLTNAIEDFIALSLTCKYFNQWLTYETIGKFFRDYGQIWKDMTWREFNTGFSIRRFPTLLLICAGADPNAKVQECPILRRAVEYNDIQMVEMLLKYHADPNPVCGFNPLFFYAKTVEMAQLLIDYGADIHVKSYIGANVIWHIVLNDESPAALMKFYLDHNVDARGLDPCDKSCLWHAFMTKACICVDCSKGELLLEAIPDMVNALNNAHQTPLDLLYAVLKDDDRAFVLNSNFYKALILLGARRAYELEGNQPECRCAIF